jgi:hypothetical protein
MKTYLSTDYSTYDEFAEALKPDLAENISFPIKAVHKTFGECFIESIRPMVQDYGVDFVISVKLPTGETKLYSYNIVVVQKSFIAVSDDVKSSLAKYLDLMAVVQSELAERFQNERKAAVEAALRAKDEARQKAKEEAKYKKRLDKLNESCSFEFFKSKFSPESRYELIGWMAKHVKHIKPTVPASMMDWFKRKFGEVENVAIVDDSKLTSGGHAMKWNLDLRATFDTQVPKALLSIANKSGKVITDVSFIYNLIDKYNFEFGDTQNIDSIKSVINENYMGQFEAGYEAK